MMKPPPSRDAESDRKKQLADWQKKRKEQQQQQQQQQQHATGRSSLGQFASRTHAEPRRGSLPAAPAFTSTSRSSSSTAVARARHSVAGGTGSASGRTSTTGTRASLPDSVSARRKTTSSSVLLGRAAPSATKHHGRSSSQKKAQLKGRRDAMQTPSPPSAATVNARSVQDENETTPPTTYTSPWAGGGKIVPAPVAVSTFMASLRAADTAHHSPCPKQGIRVTKFAGFGSAAEGSPPVLSTPPMSGVGSARPHAAAAAALALARSGGGGRRGTTADGNHGSPTEAWTSARGAPLSLATPPSAVPSGGGGGGITSYRNGGGHTHAEVEIHRHESSPSDTLAEETKAWRKSSAAAMAEAVEAKQRAEGRATEFEHRLRRVEVERAALRSDVAVLGVQMGALEAAGDEQRAELRRERAAAAEVATELEEARQEKAAAVEEREFTIEAQAGMLQQLSAELERAERCREDAERSKLSREERVTKLQAELDRCARELAARKHQLHQAQSQSQFQYQTSRGSSGGGGDVNGRSVTGRMSLDSSMSLGDGGLPHSGGTGSSAHCVEEVRAAESVARQSQERFLELVAARQAAERDAYEARAAAAKWEGEVDERRAELELMQEELEGNLEEERGERRRAEAAYATAREERDRLERLVEKRVDEIGELEEQLAEATDAANDIRAKYEKRDEMLQDGAMMLMAKEAELDEAAGYALQLQQQLDVLSVERVAAEAEVAAGLTPQWPAGSPGSREHREAREQQVIALKAENEAAAAAAARELATMRCELEQRDRSLANAASQLAARETERFRLASELADRGVAISPLRDGLQTAQTALVEMRAQIVSRDAQLAQNADALRTAVSAVKHQTTAVLRLETCLTEREETVRNMDEQLQAADAAAKEEAAAAEEERGLLSGRLSESERTLRALEARLAAVTDDNARRLARVEEERAAAIARAEALAAEVASEETQCASLAEAAAAAAQSAEYERERRMSSAAEAEEAMAANIEFVAELEGRMLQVRVEADTLIEEAEGRLEQVETEAEARVVEAEAALAASQGELAGYREELAAARDALAATTSSADVRQEELQGEAADSRRVAAEAESRCAEAHRSLTDAEERCAGLEAQLTAAAARLTAEREDKNCSLAVAAKLQIQRDDEAAAACEALRTRVAAAELAAESGAQDVDELSAAVAALREEVILQTKRADESENGARRLEDELVAAGEAASEANDDAADARSTADSVQTESLFFLGEMQAAVEKSEKQILELHKIVQSRNVKLAQMTAEVRALKVAVRQLEQNEKEAEGRLETLNKSHAEEVESARGEVEGQSVMLEMENKQLRENLEEKRSKLTQVQASLSRATEKNKQLLSQTDRARAAQSIAEERAGEAERWRIELADAFSRAEEVGQRNTSATEAVHQLQVEELVEELAAAKGQATALGRAMWENGMRPNDLDSDAADALEEAVGGGAATRTPQSTTPLVYTPASALCVMASERTPVLAGTSPAPDLRTEGGHGSVSVSKMPVVESIRQMTAEAGQISFCELKASVEAKNAATRGRSSLRIANTDADSSASPALASVRRTLAVYGDTAQPEAWNASAAPPPASVTPASTSRAASAKGAPSRGAAASDKEISVGVVAMTVMNREDGVTSSPAPRPKRSRNAVMSTSKAVTFCADAENAPPPGSVSKATLAAPSSAGKGLKSRPNGLSGASIAHSSERTGFQNSTRLSTRRKALRAMDLATRSVDA